jgi:hypothetical protein
MNELEFSFECRVCWSTCSVDKTENGVPISFYEYNDFVIICPVCGSRLRVSVNTAVLDVHHNNL